MALPLENGGVKLLTSDQSAHTTMHECAAMLGVDYDHCQVQNMLVGGGFGGKEDMSVQHHAALLAYIARVPVKVKLSRQESILVHPKRHSFDMDFTMGCDENGIIQGSRPAWCPTPVPLPLWEGRFWSGPAPMPPGPMPMKTSRSRAAPIIPTILPPEPSGASA